jgi:hypothetical protein
MTLHELSPEIGKDIERYKASFKLRRKFSRFEFAGIGFRVRAKKD